MLSLSLSLSRCCPLCNICICLVLCAPFTVMRQGYHVYAARVEGNWGNGGGECSLLIAVCLLIFIASDDPPRDRQQQILMLFSCSYFTCNHTQPPGPGPDLVTAPGLHTRTRAETYTLTHKCRENESQVSWLFTLRFLRYS